PSARRASTRDRRVALADPADGPRGPRAPRASARVRAGPAADPWRARPRALCRTTWLPRGRPRAVGAPADVGDRGGRPRGPRGSYATRGLRGARVPREAADLRLDGARARHPGGLRRPLPAFRPLRARARRRCRGVHVARVPGMVPGVARGHPAAPDRPFGGAALSVRSGPRDG